MVIMQARRLSRQAAAAAAGGGLACQPGPCMRCCAGRAGWLMHTSGMPRMPPILGRSAPRRHGARHAGTAVRRARSIVRLPWLEPSAPLLAAACLTATPSRWPLHATQLPRAAHTLPSASVGAGAFGCGNRRGAVAGCAGCIQYGIKRVSCVHGKRARSPGWWCFTRNAAHALRCELHLWGVHACVCAQARVPVLPLRPPALFASALL